MQPFHFSSHGVVNAGAPFTLADTGVSAALYPTLAAGGFCAAIEMKINHFKPVMQGPIECTSHFINLGKQVAHLGTNLAAGTLVAKASANFYIIRRQGAAARPA